MECLQYQNVCWQNDRRDLWSFKPCYKWNAFNTLNVANKILYVFSFKPCYKWNAFNTDKDNIDDFFGASFKPCYKWNAFNTRYTSVTMWASIEF